MMLRSSQNNFQPLVLKNQAWSTTNKKTESFHQVYIYANHIVSFLIVVNVLCWWGIHTNSSIVLWYLCFVYINIMKRIIQRQHDTSNLSTFRGSSEFFYRRCDFESVFLFHYWKAFETSESKIKFLPLDYSLTYFVCYVAVVVSTMVKQSIVISFPD